MDIEQHPRWLRRWGRRNRAGRQPGGRHHPWYLKIQNDKEYDLDFLACKFFIEICGLGIIGF
jgi:hypothetical protein